MRRALIAIFLLSAGTLSAQAPSGAALWRVATQALATPPALARGPTGAFWNPAAPLGARSAVGVQLVQTSDILGITGFLLAAGARLAFGNVALQAARVDVRDLLRTTTSPSGQGEIPVFAQLLGITARVGGPAVTAGATVRVHDARYDAQDQTGTTLDVGVTVQPWGRMRLAAATMFLPWNADSSAQTDAYAGVEYVVSPNLRLAGQPATLTARYGATYHPSNDLDHMLAAGLMVNGALHVDVAVTGEAAFGQRNWRPSLELGFRAGRYTVGVARAAGLNDVGATYRILLDVDLNP